MSENHLGSKPTHPANQNKAAIPEQTDENNLETAAHDFSGDFMHNAPSAPPLPPMPPVQRLHDKRLPLHLRQQTALKINRTHGNQHLQRLLAKPTTSIQREEGVSDAEHAMTIDEIIEYNDSDNVNWANMAVILAAPADKRIKCIELVLTNTWVGPDDESLLEQIWDSMGAEGISKNIALFKKSVDRGVEIANIGILSKWPEYFGQDTKSIADGYLDANSRLVIREMIDLGIPVREEEPNEEMTPDREEYLKEIQVAAAIVQDAIQAQKILEGVQVGWFRTADIYDEQIKMSGDPIEMRSLGIAKMVAPQYMAHYYKGGPPPVPASGNENPPIQSYEVVDKHWQTCKSIIEGYNKRYPGLYTLAVEDRLEELVKKDDPKQMQSMMGEALRTLVMNIIKSQMMVASGDLDYQELHPIHSQLKGGLKGPSGTNWSSEIGKVVIEQEIKGYEDKEFWVSMGLATLGAAAFVVAELASFGTATFWLAAAAGVGASATQAGMSIEKYDDLATAQKAAVTEDTKLVADGQVSAAALAAVLDTVFAFIDVASPVMRGIRAGKLGPVKGVMEVMPIDEAAKQAGKVVEGELVQKLAGGTANAQLIEEGINKLGIQKVAEATKKTPKELLEIVGEKSAVAERLKDFMSKVPLSPEEIALYQKNFPSIANDVASGKLKREVGEEIIALMIEQEGPMAVIKKAGGWKALNHPAMLGKNSKAGGMLEAWRQSLIKEMDEFMAKRFGGQAKATGTMGHLSDKDVSQLGKMGESGVVSGIDAAAHREAAVSFLAGRLGEKPQNLAGLLDVDMFVDPRRIHMYDDIFKELPKLREEAANLASSAERDIMYNTRLKNAIEAGNKELEQQIRQEMSELGVKQLDNLPKLSPEMLVQLNREIDELTARLEEAVLRKDIAAQRKLVLEIANKQAMINAAEKGGYASGGGVRAMVSERDYFPGYNPFKDPNTGAILGEIAGKDMTKSQMMAAAIDQLVKLDKYAGELAQKGSAGVKDLPGVLKNIGKYAQRFGEVMQRANFGIAADAAMWEKLAKQFDDILKGAKELPADPSLRKQVLDELASQTKAQLGELNKSHLSALKKLQQEAGIEGITGIAEALKSISDSHMYYLLAKDRAAQLLYDITSQYGRAANKNE